MSSFKNTLKKIIDEKAQNSPQLRKNIYQHARKNLLVILDQNNSSEEIKQNKIQNLEQDILALENDYITQQKASILRLNKPAPRSSLNKDFYINNITTEATTSEKIIKKDNKRIIQIFDQVKNKELRDKHKKNIFTLLLGSLFIAIFIFSCIGIAWHFFANHNRNIVKHEIINTKLETGISAKKFEDRLINENNKKHNAPIMVKTTNVATNNPVTYDSASYITFDNKTKPANISWSSLQDKNNHSVLSAKINVIDSNTNMLFVLQNNFNKNIKGNFVVNITYNDETMPVSDILTDKTELNLYIKDKKISLKDYKLYSPDGHSFIFAFNDKDNNLQNVKQAEAIELNFAYKDNKKITIKFTKDKNGKTFFDSFN